MLVNHQPFHLSRETVNYLQDNGYKFKAKDDLISFTKARDLTWLILLAGFAGIIQLLINIRSFPLGLTILCLISVGTFLIIRYARRQPFLILDYQKGKANYRLSKTEVFDLVGKVTGISTQSQLTAEYTSAMKETSKEFKIAVNFRMGSEQLIGFRLKGDYEEPDEVKELVSKIRESLNALKVVRHTDKISV